MSILTPTWFPEALYARTLATQKANGFGDEPIQNAIIGNVIGSINGGGFSTTISLSAYSAQDIQNWIQVLNGLGYTTSYSVSTLTVSW